MGQRRFGCLPGLLALILALLVAREYSGALPSIPPLQVEAFDPRTPRRPMPQWSDESFFIEDGGGKPTDSMGTAFAVNRSGAWLTAEHVTHGCARIGIEQGRFAQPIARLIESREADAALVSGGVASDHALPLSDRMPSPGSRGYHMGFPAGEPTLVLSELIGAASARRGSGQDAQPVLAWAEQTRIPIGDGPLSGISGGPVLAEDGHVVGVNSAATDRRGRILTTAPDAMMRLVLASRTVSDRPVAYPLRNAADARTRFESWLAQGAIRRIFCDVDDGPNG